MRRVLAGLGLAFLCAAAAAQAQPSPAAPGQSAAPAQAPAAADDLAVRVRVNLSFQKDAQGAEAAAAAWEAENVKYTAQGKAAPFKLVGPNIVVFVGVTPFVRKDGMGVVLIAEGQVGLKRADGGFSYQATVSKIEVGFGESVLFLPLGLESPLRVYISVLRPADIADPDPEAASEPARSAGR